MGWARDLDFLESPKNGPMHDYSLLQCFPWHIELLEQTPILTGMFQEELGMVVWLAEESSSSISPSRPLPPPLHFLKLYAVLGC